MRILLVLKCLNLNRMPVPLEIFLPTSCVCFFQFKLQSMIRHTYLTSDNCSTALCDIFKLIDWGFLWGGQRDYKFNWSHCLTLSNSSFNFNWTEYKFWSCKKMLVGAKRWKSSTLEHLWRSFTYIKNNKGPKIKPCGTLQRICFKSESIVPRKTNWLLLDK